MTEQMTQTTIARSGKRRSSNRPPACQSRSNRASWCASLSTNLILNGNWLPAELRQQGKQQLLSIFEEYVQDVPLMRSYGLYGLRSDCDFMLWQVAYAVEDLQGLSSKVRRSVMGPYLRENARVSFDDQALDLYRQECSWRA